MINSFGEIPFALHWPILFLWCKCIPRLRCFRNHRGGPWAVGFKLANPQSLICFFNLGHHRPKPMGVLAMQGALSCQREQFVFKSLAQGHLDMWTGKYGEINEDSSSWTLTQIQLPYCKDDLMKYLFQRFPLFRLSMNTVMTKLLLSVYK